MITVIAQRSSGDECRDVQLVCFLMPLEPRTRIGARESTVSGVSRGMRMGDSALADDSLIRVAINIFKCRKTVTRQIREQFEKLDFSRDFKSIVRK